jgi:hypothetical protein
MEALDAVAELQGVSRSDVIRAAIAAWVKETGDIEDLYRQTSSFDSLQLAKVVGFMCGIAESCPPVASALRKAVNNVCIQRGGKA